MPPRRPKKTRNQSRSSGEQSGERLQKVLAAAGLGSRRKCEELITDGRVEVDRQVVKELGTRVNSLTQEIRVDGQALKRQRAVYFMVNKPPGVLSTNYDPEYRVRVVDLVKANERLFTVGRLDQYSEGLILVTNDGELANRLTHPRYGATKTYHVVVAGAIEPKTLERLERGVHLAEGVARVAALKVKKQRPQSTDLEMVLEEGKNREVRRVFAAVGHKVLKLKRVQIGPLKLADLPVGAHRPLSKEEFEKLYEYAHAPRQKAPKPKRRPTVGAAASGTDYVDEPLIDESDEALADNYNSGPVLVDDELTNFDTPIRGADQGLAPRRPGAVIAFEDDDTPAPAPVAPTAPKRTPGKFSKAARREGQKKFARRDTRGDKPSGSKPGGDRSRSIYGSSSGKPSGSKPTGDRSRSAYGSSPGKPRTPGAPKKFAKKQARRKGRS